MGTGAPGIRGLDTVLRNLNVEINKIKNGTMRGLIKAAILIRRDMSQTQPYIPVDLRNLEASWFIVTARSRPETGGTFTGDDAATMVTDHAKTLLEAQALASMTNKPTVILGFSANYAAAVHEMMGAVNWSKSGSGPKFFEAALKRNTGKILQIIQDNAKIS